MSVGLGGGRAGVSDIHLCGGPRGAKRVGGGYKGRTPAPKPSPYPTATRTGTAAIRRRKTAGSDLTENQINPDFSPDVVAIVGNPRRDSRTLKLASGVAGRGDLRDAVVEQLKGRWIAKIEFSVAHGGIH